MVKNQKRVNGLRCSYQRKDRYRVNLTKLFLFASGDSSSQQHLSHTNVLVLQEQGQGGSVSGGRRHRSGGEDQTAHRERPRKQRGLRHSKGICELLMLLINFSTAAAGFTVKLTISCSFFALPLSKPFLLAAWTH